MSVILFGYSPVWQSLLDALTPIKSLRPIYLMPGDGRKGSAVRSVPVHSHQINEMTDFALAHQADAVFLLDRESISRGAADDALAVGLTVFGPTAETLRAVTLKALRGAADLSGLKAVSARAFPGPRAAADKNASWPCDLIAPDGSVRSFRSGGEIKNALNRREIASSGGEWYCAAPFDGARRRISLYRDQKNTVPFLSEEGDEKWVSAASEVLANAGYEGFFTLILRDEDGWVLEGFEPLPAPEIPWEKVLPSLI